MQLINKDSFLSYQNINTDVIALIKQLIPRWSSKIAWWFQIIIVLV